jgi:hypothetical protein
MLILDLCNFAFLTSKVKKSPYYINVLCQDDLKNNRNMRCRCNQFRAIQSYTLAQLSFEAWSSLLTRRTSNLMIAGSVGSNPVRGQPLFPWARNFTLICIISLIILNRFNIKYIIKLGLLSWFFFQKYKSCIVGVWFINVCLLIEKR